VFRMGGWIQIRIFHRTLRTDMPSQSEKYHLAMAGEYFVAAQLQRLQVVASVTYGNAKRADVVAFSEYSDRAVVIEVKTTQRHQWVVGGKVPDKSDKPWVFVHLPISANESPSFYIIKQTDLNEIITPLSQKYRQNFLEKHGQEYGERPGVINISRVLLESNKCKDNWSVIIDQLKS
jgi:hypothetical protein